MNLFKWIKSSDQRVEEALRQSGEGYNASPAKGDEMSSSVRWDDVVQGAANEAKSGLTLWTDYSYDDQGHCITWGGQSKKK